MSQNFPQLVKGINSQFPEAQYTLGRINTKKTTQGLSQ